MLAATVDGRRAARQAVDPGPGGLHHGQPSTAIVGKAVAEGDLRERVTLATKVGLEWQDGRIRRNSKRARILQEVDDSRRRLRMDLRSLPGALAGPEQARARLGTLKRSCQPARGPLQSVARGDSLVR